MKLALAVIVASATLACSSGAPFEGLAPAVDRGGPKVVFDLAANPLPQIPFPNDVATTPDPNSPTGLRFNAAIGAPTQLQANQLALLDTLDGFGTFAPISVAFDRDIDFADLFARQNDQDPGNDGVYLINLASGAPVPLDFGAGHFPYTLSNPAQYFANDPLSNTFNLLFPATGPLANVFNPQLPHVTIRQQADDLLTFYELATHTLMVRPILPLQQDARYAVVLTTRIRDAGGNPISSPHSGINHTSQNKELSPLLSHLPAGTQLSDIAYTWAFTTQSTTRGLEVLRQGLVDAAGPFLTLDFAYRISGGSATSLSVSTISVLQERGVDIGTPSPNAGDYILPVNGCAAPPAAPGCFRALLDDPDVGSVFSGTSDPATLQALEASLQYVDYLVTGAFISPNLLGTDLGRPEDHTFQADETTGTVRSQGQTVPFLLAVPKQVPAAGHLSPFPTVIAGHDFTSSRNQEVVAFGGTFAKFGLATVSIDAYGHGVVIDPALELMVRSKMAQFGLAPFAEAFFFGRERDLDFDGQPDSGGDFWTGDTFHARDTIRQSVLDQMQLVRVLRTFDGATRMALGLVPKVFAGDFNNDGIPDVAGAHVFPNTVFAADQTTHLFEAGSVNPGADLFSFGVSLGGILSGILPAVEPEVLAAAPVSAGGGLADVQVRSTLGSLVNGIFLGVMGPFLATCPFSATSGPIDPQSLMHVGACDAAAGDAVPTLVMVVQDENRERDLPVQAGLTLAPGDRVMVQNLTQAVTSDCSAAPATGCNLAVADASGNLRLAFSADAPTYAGFETTQAPGKPNAVSVSVLAPGDSLRVTVLPASGASAVVIGSFGQPFTFFGIPYQAGDPLTSLARGLGMTRNTPAFRRMMELSQLILEPADPINYAPHYANNLLAARINADPSSGFVGGPSNVLVVATAGDTGIPVSTGVALARAAGVVELSALDPDFGVTDDQVLIRGGVVEGVAATDRFDDADAGVFAALPGHVRCSGVDCTGAVLLDPSGYACDGGVCSDGFSAPRLIPPLRAQLVRATTPVTACPVSARAGTVGCWSVGASACAAGVPGLSALMLPYLSPGGQHGIASPQPGEPFDMDQFVANAIGRYFECRGGELHFDACQQDLASCPWIPPPPP